MSTMCMPLLNGQVKVSDVQPYNLAEINGSLFFWAGSTDLWKSDGTSEGTVLVKDINAGGQSIQSPSFLFDANGTAFFWADDGVHGVELWKSDGTEGGTVLVRDIDPSSILSITPYSYLAESNGNVFFWAMDGSVYSGELWKSDGTEGGTVPVKDIYPGLPGSYPYDLIDIGGTVFFMANDGIHGNELWKSDGTQEGTVMVKDIDPAGGQFHFWDEGDNNVSFNGILFFMANDGVYGNELWKSDGTEGGTIRVKDINPGAGGSFPRGFALVNGTIFFTANDGAHGYELWKSDGTENGTVLIRDIHPGNGHSSPNYLVDANGTVFFWADDGVHGLELWKSDGTEGGTSMVKDIHPTSGSLGYFPRFDGAGVGGTLFFRADDGIHGAELWVSDGTAEGTLMAGDILPGTGTSFPSYLTNVNGTLFFRANDGTGPHLWKYSPNACEITAIDVTGLGECDPIYNTYSLDLEVAFTSPPEGGMLSVNGGLFPIGASPQAVTLEGLSAGGAPFVIQAYFITDEGCGAELTIDAPAPCNSPEEIMGALQAYVQFLIDNGVLTTSGNGMKNQLRQILNKIKDGKVEEAASQLHSFIEHVNGLLADGVLSPEEAQRLLDGAYALIAQFEAESNLMASRAVSPGLGQNYPNPFFAETVIPFFLSESGPVALMIQNLDGKVMETVASESMDAGFHQVRFQAGHLPQGVYFYTLQAGDIRMTKRMVVMR